MVEHRTLGNCILDKSQLGSATYALGGGAPDGVADEALPPWAGVFPELVSLWGMITSVSLSSIAFHVKMLEHDRNRIFSYKLNLVSEDQIAQEIRSLLTTLKYLAGVCQRNGLPDSCDRINNALREIKFATELKEATSNNDRYYIDIGNQIAMIYEVFHREAGKHYFAHITPNKSAMLLSIESDWSPIWEKFQSSEAPSRAAVEAYAVGLNEASIYHTMMILEVGLKSLSRRLRVKYDRQQWGTIIKNIEDELKRMSASAGNTPKGSKPLSPGAASRFRADITLFSTAATEFVWFKDAWRNHVAHNRAKYDENDALKIITHVRSFMERLSMRLKETRR